MLIQVLYGYKQSAIFNINSQIAPLLDCIQRQALSEVLALLNAKESLFNTEKTEIAGNLEKLQKKLYKLENPVVEEEPEKSGRGKRQVKEPTPEVKEEEPVPEVEKKEIKKQETKKGGKKPPPAEEVKELSPEEIKQQKLEALKEEVRNSIDQLNARAEKLTEKLAMLKTTKTQFQNAPTEIDLQDLNGNRKNLRNRLDDTASALLNTKTSYNLLIVGESEVIPFDVDGFCVRTIEEDAVAQEEPDPKAKGKKSPVKKK